ncbi:MAG: FtsQ-type POTRA domain-containing protein, partial [Spirochaetaceae bacterium]
MADRVSYPQYDPSHDYHFVPPLHAVKVDATKGGGSKGRRRSGGMMRRIVFAFLFVGSALLAAEILFQTVLAPRMAIRKIIIESDLPFSQEYLLRSAGINEGDLYFSVDTQKIQEQLSSIPLVEQAEVEKRFPGQLRMVLHKRTPLAVAAMSGSQGPLVIDANGVVFQQGYPRDYKSLPVLSGFEVANIELGASLPAAMRVALSDLEVLRMHHPVLFNLISEIEYEMVHE